jgi:hypothetical protein
LDKDPTDPTGTKCQSNFMLLNLAGILGAKIISPDISTIIYKKISKKNV